MGSTRYLLGLAPVIVLTAVSAGANPDLRRTLWIVILVFWLSSVLISSLRSDDTANEALRVTESMAERFGLFTIIVLGEVVVGVVQGLSETERSARTVTTGLLALGIGYGIWWTYFDFVGGRQPRQDARSRTVWLWAHLPLVLAVAASGAGMASLIEHATDARTPASTAWLLAGGIAAVATSIAVLMHTLPPNRTRRRVPLGLLLAGGVAVSAAAMEPAPWLLALVLYAVLSGVWVQAFVRHALDGSSIAEG